MLRVKVCFEIWDVAVNIIQNSNIIISNQLFYQKGHDKN